MEDLIKNLLRRLRDSDIYLKVNYNEELEITVKHGKIPSELVQEIREHKQDIISYLKSAENRSENKIEKARPAESYVTSSAQKSLWIVSQDEIASIAYNIPSYKLLQGVKDIAILKKAINAVIDRHEILRTVFKNDDQGELKQFILDFNALNFKAHHIDLREEEEREKSVFKYIQNDSYQPFDLEKGPLLRVAFLQISEESFYFYYNLHHIISDGWSNAILEKEVLAFYNFYLDGTAINLPELETQYKDYAVWENSLFESGKMESYKKFWTDKLAGELPRINLPANKQRPKFKTYNGHQFQAYIAADELAGTKKLLQKEGGTLFTSILAILKILLYKYTNERDITIGFPIVNRDEFNLQNQIGYYIKPLALRDYLSPEDTFSTFYQKLKKNTFLAFNNKQYPFQVLVNDLKLDYDPARNPLFDISLTFHNISSENQFNKNFDHTIIDDLGASKCKQDIEFHFQELGDHLSFMVNFNTDVYESEMIIRFMKHFKQILSTLVNNPDSPIDDLNYLTEVEKSKLIHDFNNTAVDYPKNNTLISLFQQQVKNIPDTIAVVFEDKALTYSELDLLSDRLAYNLQENYNIQKGDFIGVQLNRSEWFIVSILGILKAGAVYVPIDPHLPADRKAFIFEDADLKLLITETLFIFDLNFYEGHVFSIDVEFDGTLEVHYQQPKLSPDDLAYIIYTSGSTGNPKGVAIEHAGIVNTILSQIDIFELKNCKNSLQLASFSFDASISEIFITLLSGSSLYVLNDETRMDVKLFEKYIIENKIDIATITPAYLKLLDISSLKDLKVLISAGESAVYDKVVEYLQYGTFYNAYGPTETSICATIFKIEKDSKLNTVNIPIGKPIANTAIYILNEFLSPCSINVTGEIYIGGNGLARGYLNRTDLTKEKFIPNPFKEGELMYRSGDLGKWLPDGNVEFAERADDQVKIRGHRIELGEIENSISQIKGISHSVVVIRENEGDKFLVAYYVLNDVLDKKEIQSQLIKVLPDYMLPSYYIQLNSIPLTINGKIDKKALPAVKEDDLIKTAYVPATTTEEKVLADVWKLVLKCDTIGLKDNFYNLGGDSIKAISIVSNLKQQGYLLKIDYLLKNPILEDLSKLISKNSVEKSSSEKQIVASDHEKIWEIGDVIALSPNQKRFYKMKYSAVSFSFTMPYFNVFQFEEKFRIFLSHFPNLTIKYEENEDGVFQRYISANETKIKILVNKPEVNDEKQIYNTGKEFLLDKPFDLLHGELIRAFVVPDVSKLKATIFVALHHSLADAYTTDILVEQAVAYFEKDREIKKFHHPFQFIALQQQYLNSEEAFEKRMYLVENLEDQRLYNHVTKEIEREDFLEQEMIISGQEFKKIQEFSKDLNLPVSAIFNAFFLMILNKTGKEDQKLYQILVNNREREVKGLQTENILGVIDDVLIANYFNNDFDLSIEFIRNNYLQYLNDRIEQTIPYETIREDFRIASGIDLDRNVIGFLNFLISETEIDNVENTEKSTIKETKTDIGFDLSLVCKLFLNGITVKLVCKKHFYDENKNVLSLEQYVEEFLSVLAENQNINIADQYNK
ncbi:non-ribosomal peptide synthetase [Flavobacterium branchiicola]|uniref:Non-ribosomal peptide synthetase n=1 Tax=Flavobacterium branchiicola TaxID=1114875 RepID=A0ABV9PII9_9FLAO|nr:non-ribosomal peptide synthetase [Flavobacterium branchiicola]MBS7256346.1 amino acid adenylation domain-containing protein [Flavobacterium branchiicola]